MSRPLTLRFFYVLARLIQDVAVELECGGAKVQVTGHRSGHRPQVRSQVRLQATGHRSQVTGQATGHRPQIRSQVTKNNRTLGKTVLD